MATAKYRADHVGSLLRPPEMLEARKAYDEKKISWDELQATANKFGKEALKVQQEAGVDVFTDGEYRRSWWAGAMFDSLDGFVEIPDPAPPLPPGMAWQGTSAGLALQAHTEVLGAWVVGAKLKRTRGLVEEEAKFLKANAPGPWKVTFAAISNRAAGWFRKGVTDAAYASPDEMEKDLIAFLNGEIHACIDLGCNYVQLDSLRYTAWMDPERRQALVASGVTDLDSALNKLLAVDNACIAGARGKNPNLVVGHHICRGNNRSSWTGGVGGYEAVAEKLFNTMNVDRFLLEYDTERAGGFEPLRFVPRDKMVVLGIVSSKIGAPESKDSLIRRIDEASKYIAVDQLAISPQCGFASTAPGNLLSWDEQKRKLELVASVAREVWKD
jgi:5-methyltetrahydropteroyltriglutamate--homocysteine methyltransferase